MSKRSSERVATYSPQQFKSFPGALNAFLSTECPQLGGQRTRQVLVQAIVEMIERFYPPSTHLHAGQTPWVTVDKDEKASYGKRMSQTRLTGVVLDLVPAEEATERKDGKKLRAIKKEAVARVFTQAYEQGGCLTNVETALLLKMSPSTVSKYTREWELENETLLPRRGTIHDMGPTLTHKKEIIERLFLQGKSVEQVMRETYHSAEAITRYIVAFKQVLLCHRKGLSTDEIAFAVKMSKRLVEEYQRLITELASKNQSLDQLIEDSLGSLLSAKEETTTV
jgi:DNA-binding CsgD family transcriptional regulator